MKNKKTIVISIVLTLFIVSLAFGFWSLSRKVIDLEARLEKKSADTDVGKITDNSKVYELSGIDKCGNECREEIAQLVSDAVATLSGETKTIVKEIATNTSERQTSYIPVGTTYSTKSTDWVDVPDSSVYVDLVNDYGDNTWVTWEASLKVSQGNGKAFARLYDDTNKIAVNFSELVTEENASFKQAISSNLPFWRGRNLYKVQIKSLTTADVTYSGGRIKINY